MDLLQFQLQTRHVGVFGERTTGNYCQQTGVWINHQILITLFSTYTVNSATQKTHKDTAWGGLQWFSVPLNSLVGGASSWSKDGSCVPDSHVPEVLASCDAMLPAMNCVHRGVLTLSSSLSNIIVHHSKHTLP